MFAKKRFQKRDTELSTKLTDDKKNEKVRKVKTKLQIASNEISQDEISNTDEIIELSKVSDEEFGSLEGKFQYVYRINEYIHKESLLKWTSFRAGPTKFCSILLHALQLFLKRISPVTLPS